MELFAEGPEEFYWNSLTATTAPFAFSFTKS